MKKRYGYDKKALRGLGYTKFLTEVHERNKIIEAQPEEEIVSKYNANILAERLHPRAQYVKVAEVTELKDARRFKLVPDKERGTERLAFFRAGQYVTVHVIIGKTDEAGDGPTDTLKSGMSSGTESVMIRPYSLCSAPMAALGEAPFYEILVKKVPDGFVSSWILENWKPGSETVLSGPLGYFYYQDLRDAEHVIAAAGGSGITPFLSMAGAVKDGTEKFKLTILYGCRTEADILLKQELDELASHDGIRVVYVLSDEEKAGYEHGFISAELIRKYADETDFSLFACGPAAMYDFLKKQAEALKLPRRLVRFEVSGGARNIAADSGFPKEKLGESYELKLLVHGEMIVTKCRTEETVLTAIERAGVHAPSECRSGECGFCRSRLISGEVYIPADTDKRRMADARYGWIHPCSSYPVSDLEIEVYPVDAV